ncbi:endonuclease-1 [Tetraselmis virus 1]|uniref:Endonuclease-1 n=1 Tax=Tetraselmis virus 1 TaxID=2060617 RepID=A0A2P0VMP9_9VIRU|nr:endonuclease-1 [Tetraselmis virus 1]AUF82166.1 endonuclease-1 [Tetraselmis virus 1]
MDEFVKDTRRNLDYVFESLLNTKSASNFGKFLTKPDWISYSSYTNIDVYDSLKLTDRDPDNVDNIILLYSRNSIHPGVKDKEYLSGWNREHVWPKSKGGYMSVSKPGIGTDLHNLFPADSSVNSTRSNRDFKDLTDDNTASRVIDNTPLEGGSRVLDNVLYTSDYWSPPPDAKGPISRAVLYMACMYAENGLRITNSASKSEYELGCLDDILMWNMQYPPTENEKYRNDVIESIQGNRNPFIDAPYLANKIDFLRI